MSASEYDINHAIFVRQAYRYVPKIDPTVKARNPEAREVTIDTNLGQATATVIAQAILQENNKPRAFEFTVEGTQVANITAGGPPSFIINSTRLASDGVARKVFSETVDYDKDRTTYQVRG